MSTATIADADASTISLRDWFAGQILAALIVAPKQPGVSRQEPEAMARTAYEQADTMLKVRSQ